MFFGEYTYKVDEKGRVPLPPRFRRQMKEGVILTKGMGEKYIAVYPVAEWKRLSDSLAAKVVTPANMRRLNRAIHGSAFGASLDGQGRIILPLSIASLWKGAVSGFILYRKGDNLQVLLSPHAQ